MSKPEVNLPGVSLDALFDWCQQVKATLTFPAPTDDDGPALLTLSVCLDPSKTDVTVVTVEGAESPERALRTAISRLLTEEEALHRRKSIRRVPDLPSAARKEA